MEVQCEPVREIDQVLVLDHATGNIRAQAIVAAGELGPGIVHVVRLRPLLEQTDPFLLVLKIQYVQRERASAIG